VAAYKKLVLCGVARTSPPPTKLVFAERRGTSHSVKTSFVIKGGENLFCWVVRTSPPLALPASCRQLQVVDNNKTSFLFIF